MAKGCTGYSSTLKRSNSCNPAQMRHTASGSTPDIPTNAQILRCGVNLTHLGDTIRFSVDELSHSAHLRVDCKLES
jgi:hypothetical protein